MRKTRSTDQYARPYFYRDGPPDFWSHAITAMIELRATASTTDKWALGSKRDSWARAKTCNNWIQSTRLENTPSNNTTRRDGEFVCIFKQFTKILRHGGCHGAEEQYDGQMFGHAWKMLSKLKKWNVEDWIGVFSCSEWSVVKTTTERLWTFVQHKATTMVLQSINSTLFSLERTLLSWKEHITIPNQ